MQSKGTLYLIPNLIADDTAEKAIPAYNAMLLGSLNYFICEHAKSLRALLKASGVASPYDHLTYFELNKHTDRFELESFIKPLLSGFDMGLVSDAGCPGIADPGAQIVALAHAQGIKVLPLIGPSSIFMALMGSGFNGQKFSFHGYLPQKEPQLKKYLAEVERSIATEQSSHIFIEAPYRNTKLLQLLIKLLNPAQKLCLAINLSAENQRIETKTLGEWKKKLPEIDKLPTVFVLGS
ncbi:SAM-dependent methyltransferase [bacterium]|nr:SAM-dependent methyltransferase [bacterium]